MELTNKPLISKRIIIITDFMILAGIIIGMSVFAMHADLVLMTAYVAVVAYAVYLRRYKSLIHLAISTLIALVWVFIARSNYGYNHYYYSVFGMNILPLLAWALGLIGVSELYNYVNIRNKLLKFLFFIPLFWLLLILIETYAFHVIEIRDTNSGNPLGLPFCNCIHAPGWMRVAYFSMGPAYYGLTLFADKLYDKLAERAIRQ